MGLFKKSVDFLNSLNFFRGIGKKALESTNRAKTLVLGYPKAYVYTPRGKVC